MKAEGTFRSFDLAAKRLQNLEIFSTNEIISFFSYFTHILEDSQKEIFTHAQCRQLLQRYELLHELIQTKTDTFKALVPLFFSLISNEILSSALTDSRLVKEHFERKQSDGPLQIEKDTTIFDSYSNSLFISGTRVPLGIKEGQVCSILFSRPNLVVSEDCFSEQGSQISRNQHSLYYLILKIEKKLSSNNSELKISRKRSMGYVLKSRK